MEAWPDFSSGSAIGHWCTFIIKITYNEADVDGKVIDVFEKGFPTFSQSGQKASLVRIFGKDLW